MKKIAHVIVNDTTTTSKGTTPYTAGMPVGHPIGDHDPKPDHVIWAWWDDHEVSDHECFVELLEQIVPDKDIQSLILKDPNSFHVRIYTHPVVNQYGTDSALRWWFTVSGK